MSYLLEWQTDEDRDPLCLVRHVRVFRNAGGLKAFLRSRAFQRLAGSEVRLQHRARGQKPEAVITTIAAVLSWDPGAQRLPPALADSAWAEALTALSLRGQLIERMAAEFGTAQRLDLLSADQAQQMLALLHMLLTQHAQTRLPGGPARA